MFLLAGAAWCVLILYLLLRMLRQFRLHSGGAIPVHDAPDGPAASVLVVVPARNEAANIEPCLSGLLVQRYPADRLRVCVVDDDSQDDTAGIAARIAAADGRLRLLRAGPLPPGWLGKPHACWRGSRAASAEWLCFLDADVRPGAALIGSAVRAAEAQRLDLLSLHPRQELGSFSERLIIPAGALLVACAKDLGEVADPASAEANVNGQVLLVRRAAYEAIGGHAAVRAEVGEDRALARLAKSAGFRVRVQFAEHLASARMYRDFAGLWEGFGKNAVDIMGDVPRTLLVALAGFLIGWAVPLLPIGLALAALADGAAVPGALAATLGSTVAVAVQAGTARHFRLPRALAALFPLGFTLAALLACHSVWLRARGRVGWKGRCYLLGAGAAAGEP